MSRGPNSVTATVAARLHLGFLDLNGELGRRFGSFGLAISGFCTRVTVSRAAQLHVNGPDSDRARRYVEQLQEFLGLGGAHRVEIADAIPAHAGLGSGTQLALALAACIRRLHGLPLDVRRDAFQLGRGRRSGVGIGLFDDGGVVVDGGCGEGTEVAPILSRMPFPEAWRILLVLDRTRAGVHGDEEIAAFARLPPFAAANAARICRLVLMQALPALAEVDLGRFASAVKEIQDFLGAYFAPLQGGQPFASPDVGAALKLLEEEGALGIGQSSWGPTGFAFVPTQEAAERLVNLVRKHPRFQRLEIHTCNGLNRGAVVTPQAFAAASRS